jgi:hypothetical protein
MSEELTTTNQIASIFEGIVVTNSGFVARWKWQILSLVLVRVAEGRPRPGDEEFSQREMAQHTVLQETTTAARTALKTAGFPGAARRIEDLQEDARHHEQNRNPDSQQTPKERRPGGQGQLQGPVEPFGFPTWQNRRNPERVLETEKRTSTSASRGLASGQHWLNQAPVYKRGLVSAKGGRNGRRSKGISRAQTANK